MPAPEKRAPFYAPRALRIVYQVFFLVLFALTLLMMSDEGVHRFPVQWLFHLDPLAALSVLLSSWVLPVAFLWALVIVALTLLFGRVFCGWLCPIGTLHHLVSWATRRLRRGPPATVNRWRPHFRWKYLLLVVLLAVAALGSLQPGLLDPISLGLRSFAGGLLPAASAVVMPDGFRPRLYQGAWLTGGILLALLAANAVVARWWCRALCPLGALLGFVARAAIWRIQVDPERCTHCNQCAADCQGADEPFANHRVSECHGCLNCIAACPEGAIRFRAFAPAAAPAGGVALPRRQFIGAAATGAALFPLYRASAGAAGSLPPEAIRPPGALAEKEFLARCLRCGACGNACPTAAIQPSFAETGLEGIYTPIVVPRRGWCEPSCTLCGQVCPSGALRPLTADEKGWSRPGGYGVRIGTAFVDRGRCLPWAMATPCIVCQEVCPTAPKAIRLEAATAIGRDGRPVALQRPVVDPVGCVGCGLCEAKCPVVDLAAIRVTRAGESRSPASAFTLGAAALVVMAGFGGAAAATPAVAATPAAAVTAAATVTAAAATPPAANAPRAPAGVRPSALAGSWYPGRHSLIAAEVDRLVRATAAAPALAAKPLAIIVPHAGWRYSAYAAAAAFRTMEPGDYDRVVIVAPSHHAFFDGFSVPEATAFRTPAGDVPICRDVMKKLRDGVLVKTVAGTHEPEHSVEVELPFLQERLGGFCLVPILAGRSDAAGQAEIAARLARLDDGRTLFVFSSDFTHYGPRYSYTPFGPRAADARAAIRDLDERAMTLIAARDAAGFRAFLDETSDTICGREPIKVLLEMLPRIAPKAKGARLAYYTSADLPGAADDGAVSYVAMAFVDGAAGRGKPDAAPTAPLGAPAPVSPVAPDAPPLPGDVGASLLRLARATVRTELLGTDDVTTALRDLPPGARAALVRLQATFVTLRRKEPAAAPPSERLRGCIGQVSPSYPLPESVVVSAAGAALNDPRFPPVKAEELPGLEVELTVLSPPRPIASWHDIVLGRHGIVIAKGGRRAVFLPEVPVQEKWTLEETLVHLARKAGLPEDAWREGADFQVFEAQVFEEAR